MTIHKKHCFYLLLFLSVQPHLSSSSSLRRNERSSSPLQEQTQTPKARTLAYTSMEQQKKQRIAASRVGTQRLLAIRVSSSAGAGGGEFPTESLDEMEGAIFGTGPNASSDGVSLTAQFRAVSHSQLIYEPAVIPTRSISSAIASTTASSSGPSHGGDNNSSTSRPGLLEIEIEVSTIAPSGADTADFQYLTTVVRPAVLAAAERALGRPVTDVADRVMFCLPTGSLQSTTAALGEVGGMFTYFHLGNCVKLDVLMHELGHNLNFQHSSMGAIEYGDTSGYMGGPQSPPLSKSGWRRHKAKTAAAAAVVTGYPQKAYNGHKQWLSGWFQDRAIDVDPSVVGSTLQRVVSFVDYGKNESMRSGDAVLIRVGTLYMQYNRAKGYNVDAPEADRLTIVEALTDHDYSYRVAALALGETHRHTLNVTVADTASGSSHALIVKVCALTKESERSGAVDYADVSIHLDNGVQQSRCPTVNKAGRHATGPQSGRHPALTKMMSRLGGAFHSSDPVRTAVCVIVLFVVLCLVVASFVRRVCVKHASSSSCCLCTRFWLRGSCRGSKSDSAEKSVVDDSTDRGYSEAASTVVDDNVV